MLINHFIPSVSTVNIWRINVEDKKIPMPDIGISETWEVDSLSIKLRLPDGGNFDSKTTPQEADEAKNISVFPKTLAQPNIESQEFTWPG